MWILQLSLEEIINKVNEKERDCLEQNSLFLVYNIYKLFSSIFSFFPLYKFRNNN